MHAVPHYTRGSTYDGTTQDIIRVLHESRARGAVHVEIRTDKWHVIADWPTSEEADV